MGHRPGGVAGPTAARRAIPQANFARWVSRMEYRAGSRGVGSGRRKEEDVDVEDCRPGDGNVSHHVPT